MESGDSRLVLAPDGFVILTQSFDHPWAHLMCRKLGAILNHFSDTSPQGNFRSHDSTADGLKKHRKSCHKVYPCLCPKSGPGPPLRAYGLRSHTLLATPASQILRHRDPEQPVIRGRKSCKGRDDTLTPATDGQRSRLDTECTPGARAQR